MIPTPNADHVCAVGVLVLDRVNGVAYVALSERADQQLAEQWVSGLQLLARLVVAVVVCCTWK
jgi:hypothetical protein